MKKTLIAAGIAAVVAAPAAFAEVKISGVVEQAFTATENSTFAGNADNAISFSASEDLGNGLTAFAKIVLDSDAGTGSTGDTGTKDEVVGLKGSFGTFVTGRMEDFTRSKLTSKMTFEGAAGSGGSGLEGQMNDGSSRDDGAFAYVSPTMNGFHFGVASYADNATDVAAFYDNGPLSIAVARETVKKTTSAQKDQKTTNMAISYSMGDIKATIMRSDVDNESNTANKDGSDMAYRVDYKMGNNTISLGYLDNEDANATTGGTDAGEYMVVEAIHNFSKQTSVYATYTSDDAPAAGTDVDTFTVGMKHKF